MARTRRGAIDVLWYVSICVDGACAVVWHGACDVVWIVQGAWFLGEESVPRSVAVAEQELELVVVS